MTFTFATVYTEEHKTGTFHAEDHGADTAGVFYKSRRMKKPKYIATARVSDLESIKRRIRWYISFAELDS
jgi:hypothetical protein